MGIGAIRSYSLIPAYSALSTQQYKETLAEKLFEQKGLEIAGNIGFLQSSLEEPQKISTTQYPNPPRFAIPQTTTPSNSLSTATKGTKIDIKV